MGFKMSVFTPHMLLTFYKCSFYLPIPSFKVAKIKEFTGPYLLIRGSAQFG